MSGLSRLDLRFIPRLVKWTKPDVEDVILPLGMDVFFSRDTDWYHVLEICWDQPIFVITLSEVYYRLRGLSESKEAEIEDRIFDPSPLMCREEMSSESNVSKAKALARVNELRAGSKTMSSSSAPL